MGQDTETETETTEYDDVELTDGEREALEESDAADAADAASDADSDSGDDGADDTGADSDSEADEGDDNDQSSPGEQEEVEGDAEDQANSGTDDEAESGAQGSSETETPATESEADDTADRLAAIGTEREALNQAYDDGDLDTTEYMDAREKLSKQESDIEWEQRKQEIKRDAAVEADNKAWEDASRTFAAENQRYFGSAAMTAAMQASVNEVFADPKFRTSSHLDRLNEAKRRTDEALGIVATPTPAADPGKANDAKRKAMKGRGTEAGKVAPTIGDAPAADETTAGSGGKFAYMDDLEGVDYERAIANMSEEEADAWRASGH